MPNSRLRSKILDSYYALASGREEFVPLADLREQLDEMGIDDHDVISRELIAMYRAQIVNLVPWADNSRVNARDRAAAVQCGGVSKHRISVYDSNQGM